DVFRNAFQFVLNSATQSALHRSTPIEYIWDDHDYGPNNSDSTARGRQAARLTYREYVPHYPLAERDPFGAIYHSFTIGRARFIVCDARSARSPAGATDDAEKTMLGKTQKAWFKRQLLDARNRGQLIVWANSLPWIGTNGDDGWYRYTHERRELANFIKDSLITRLCMISGDAHMTAIDDGANSDYADGGGAGFPVMHAAPLHRTPSAKGGPYSHGVFLSSSGQFGTMSVTDAGDSITVTWKGWRLKRLLAEYSFSFPMAECPEDYLCGDTDSDGRVDTADVLRLLNFYFRAGTAPCPRAAGDVNCDGLIDLADIVYLIYFVNGAIPTLCCQNTPQDPGSPRLYYPEAKED
ncbi:MAG: alkaline phosphatase D family protein, partial [Candidatus Zixiibacteriota bacterium]